MNTTDCDVITTDNYAVTMIASRYIKSRDNIIEAMKYYYFNCEPYGTFRDLKRQGLLNLETDRLKKLLVELLTEAINRDYISRLSTGTPSSHNIKMIDIALGPENRTLLDRIHGVKDTVYSKNKLMRSMIDRIKNPKVIVTGLKFCNSKLANQDCHESVLEFFSDNSNDIEDMKAELVNKAIDLIALDYEPVILNTGEMRQTHNEFLRTIM